MKKVLLISVLTLTLPNFANAASHKAVPSTIIQQARNEVKQAFCKDGKQGLIDLVSNCYLTDDNKEKCMLEDSALIVFDKQMNTLYKSQTGKDMPQESGFLSDEAIETRAKLYYIPRFGSIKKAMVYFNKGGILIINDMTQCQNN